MKQILFLLCLVLITTSLKAQYIHKIKGDTVLITNDSCSAELNIENSTKLINGFLYNRGNGRTEFRRGMIKINDSLYLFGNDTLNLKAAISLVGSNSVNIYNSNGTLTGNRFLDLGSSSLSIGKSSSTNFSVFNNGLSWLGNGTPTVGANGLHNQHLLTASAGNGKGLYINDSMIASANNDTLVALDIKPGFNSNSFTGVYGIDLRTKNANVVFGNSYGYGKQYGIENDGVFQLKTAGTYKTQLWLRPAGNVTNFHLKYWGLIELDQNKMSIISPEYGALYLQTASNSYGTHVGGYGSNYGMYIHSLNRSIHMPGVVNIGGTSTDDSTAMLKVVSTTRGFLPPVWTQAQRLAIDGVSKGLIGYQSDNTENMYLYKSTGWKKILTDDDGPRRTVLQNDVASSTSQNTLTDVTNLSFSAEANTTYKFKFYIVYSAASANTGSGWSINGTQTPSNLHYTTTYSLTSTSVTTNQGMSSYNQPGTTNASSASTGSNVAVIEGVIRLGSSGTVIARFASESNNNVITALGGFSYVEFEKIQ